MLPISHSENGSTIVDLSNSPFLSFFLSFMYNLTSKYSNKMIEFLKINMQSNKD